MKNEDLLRQIAYLYYEKNYTQQQISQKLFISRSQISRLLIEAKENGIVQINIRYPYDKDTNITQEFTQYFSLDEARLINSAHLDTAETLELVCEMAADFLCQNIDNDTVLGLSRGRTMRFLTKHLKVIRSFPELKVVQVSGIPENTRRPDFEEIDLVRKIADLYRGTAYCLPLPYIVENKKSKNVILNSPHAQTLLELAQKINFYLTPITSMSQIEEYYPARDLKFLQVKGAVGSIAGYFYDINGNIIDTPLYNRLIIPERGIFSVEKRVAITSDSYKTQALLGAIRGKLVNVVISDTIMAQRLMLLDKKNK